MANEIESKTDQMDRTSASSLVARGGMIMMVSLLLSRVLGIVREMIITAQFGQNAYTDAYTLAFQIPDLLFYLISGGALSSAFIPVFTEHLYTGDEKKAWHIFSVVTTVMSIVITVAIILLWLFAAPLTAMIAGDKDPSLFPLITQMSRIILPAQFAFFIGGLLIGTLYARKVFTIPGLGPNIYNLGIIFGAVFLASRFQPGVIGMAWGALIGAFLGSLVLPLIATIKLGFTFKPSFDLKDDGVRKVFRLMAPVVFGLSLSTIFPMITQYFATYYDDGVNTALKNANQLMQAPLGVFGQSLALASFSVLSMFWAQGRKDAFRDQLQSTLKTVLFLSVPFTAMFLAFSHEIVRAIFQRGEFSANDTSRTASALIAYGVGVFAWCVHPVLMRAYFSIQKTLLPIVMGTICTIAYVVVSWLTVRSGMGFENLPIAGSVCAVCLELAMLIGLNKVVGPIDFKGLALTLGKSLAASFLAAAILWGGLKVAPQLLQNAGMKQVMATGLFLLVFAWAYFGLAMVFRMPETAYITRALLRKKAKVEPETISQGDEV